MAYLARGRAVAAAAGLGGAGGLLAGAVGRGGPPRALAGSPGQLLAQQRVEAARGGVVRLVLQDQPAVLERLRVLAPHDRRQELRTRDSDRTGPRRRARSAGGAHLGEVLARGRRRVLAVGAVLRDGGGAPRRRGHRRRGRRRARAQAEVLAGRPVAHGLRPLRGRWRGRGRGGRGPPAAALRPGELRGARPPRRLAGAPGGGTRRPAAGRRGLRGRLLRLGAPLGQTKRGARGGVEPAGRRRRRGRPEGAGPRGRRGLRRRARRARPVQPRVRQGSPEHELAAPGALLTRSSGSGARPRRVPAYRAGASEPPRPCGRAAGRAALTDAGRARRSGGPSRVPSAGAGRRGRSRRPRRGCPGRAAAGPLWRPWAAPPRAPPARRGGGRRARAGRAPRSRRATRPSPRA